MKKAILKSADSLALEFINFKWNCSSRSGVVSRIFRLLGHKWADVDNLRKYLVDEKSRMDKYDFGHYYGNEIIDTLDELVKTVKKDSKGKVGFSPEIIVGMKIRKALKEDYSFREFNWKNYHALEEANMLDVISDFDTYFRGNIDKVHKVHEDRYVIIESKIHPYDYDKQRVKFHEPEEIQFYALKKDDKGVYRNDSTLYRSFEDALFSVICPQWSGAMSALLRDSKRDS